jgi:hypothetical protein
LFLAIGGANGATPIDSSTIDQFHQFTGARGSTNDLSGGVALPFISGARRDFGIATLDDARVFIIGGRPRRRRRQLRNLPLGPAMDEVDGRLRRAAIAG